MEKAAPINVSSVMVETGSRFRHRLRLLDTEGADIASITGTMLLGT
jgi:hypothetical protein